MFPPVGEAPQLVHVVLLGGEFDQLVGGRCVAAVREASKLVDVALFRCELDEFVGRIGAARVREAAQFGQLSAYVGFRHEGHLFRGVGSGPVGPGRGVSGFSVTLASRGV